MGGLSNRGGPKVDEVGVEKGWIEPENFGRDSPAPVREGLGFGCCLSPSEKTALGATSSVLELINAVKLIKPTSNAAISRISTFLIFMIV